MIFFKKINRKNHFFAFFIKKNCTFAKIFQMVFNGLRLFGKIKLKR